MGDVLQLLYKTSGERSSNQRMFLTDGAGRQGVHSGASAGCTTTADIALTPNCIHVLSYGDDDNHDSKLNGKHTVRLDADAYDWRVGLVCVGIGR